MNRIFKGGGLRDTSDGKLEYYGFRHPLLEQSFANYMNSHRKMSDGTFRDSNNWWKGWDSIISLQSLVRHVEDLQALKAGYVVFEIRDEMGVHKEYINGIELANDKVKDWRKMKVDFKWITEEECCNAIRFNADAYKLQIIQ